MHFAVMHLAIFKWMGTSSRYEILNDEESREPSGQRSRQETCSPLSPKGFTFGSYSNYSFFLGFVIGLLFPAFWWVLATQRACQAVELSYTPVPNFPLETRTFEWNYTMSGLRNPASEAGWNSLLPFGRGYIFVADPSTYSLPPGETAPNGQIYSVALYHQLHCLSIIRRDYFDLLDGAMSNSSNLHTEAEKQILNSHNRHCMDYIRQTFECNSDMTIEWQRSERDGRRFQVDGMHIPHQCKSKQSVHDYMQRQMIKVEMERHLQARSTSKASDGGPKL